MASSYTKHRRRLFKNQGSRCGYCHKLTPFHEFTVDHIQPRSRGGSDSPHNLVGACQWCNNKKGNRNPAEFAMNVAIKKNLKHIQGIEGDWYHRWGNAQEGTWSLLFEGIYRVWKQKTTYREFINKVERRYKWKSWLLTKFVSLIKAIPYE